MNAILSESTFYRQQGKQRHWGGYGIQEPRWWCRKQLGSATSSSHLAKPSSSFCQAGGASKETERQIVLRTKTCIRGEWKQCSLWQIQVWIPIWKRVGNKPSDCMPYKDEEYTILASCAPLSLSCLQLNTPDNRESSVVKAGGSKKQSNHLRKLMFDDFCDSPNVCNKDSSEDDRSESEKKSECFTSPKTGFWDCCSTSYSPSLDFESSEENTIANCVGEISSKLSEKPGSCLSKRLILSLFWNESDRHPVKHQWMQLTLTNLGAGFNDVRVRQQQSPCNNGFKSLDLDGLSKSSQCSEFLEETDKLEERTKPNLSKRFSNYWSVRKWKWMETQFFFLLSPSDQEMNEDFSLHFQFQTQEPMKSNHQVVCFRLSFPRVFC